MNLISEKTNSFFLEYRLSFIELHFLFLMAPTLWQIIRDTLDFFPIDTNL